MHQQLNLQFFPAAACPGDIIAQNVPQIASEARFIEELLLSWGRTRLQGLTLALAPEASAEHLLICLDRDEKPLAFAGVHLEQVRRIYGPHPPA